MGIEFTNTQVTAKLLKTGQDTFTVSAGKSLRVETSPDGVEYLNLECPEGKSWKVMVYVSIEETNV